MRIAGISYERLKNLGDYNNERVRVDVVLNEDESPIEAFDRAKKFVDRRLRKADVPYSVTRAREIVADTENHTPNQVKDAQERLAKWEAENGEDSDEF